MNIVTQHGHHEFNTMILDRIGLRKDIIIRIDTI